MENEIQIKGGRSQQHDLYQTNQPYQWASAYSLNSKSNDSM